MSEPTEREWLEGLRYEDKFPEAGDGGRAPDASEQRAKSHDAGIEAAMRAVYDRWPQVNAETRAPRPYEAVYGSMPLENAEDRAEMEVAVAAYISRADPASVLAALLAEQPDATIAALEALLTSDEQLTAAHDHWQERVGWRANRYELRTILKASVVAACRSLRPKAPKEDRDA